MRQIASPAGALRGQPAQAGRYPMNRDRARRTVWVAGRGLTCYSAPHIQTDDMGETIVDATWLQIVLILASGLVAGFVNALAGGGSFLTLAALEFAGLSAATANGTNRVAVLVQNVFAVLGFHSKGVFDYRASMRYALPSVLGSVVGALVVVRLDERIFHRALAVAMLVMLVTLVFDTDKWIKEKRAGAGPISLWIVYPAFFLVGFYGGAIQAGVGFFLIAALVAVAGLDLVRTNSMKEFIIGLFTVVALLVFVLQGHVTWLLGAVLSIGNATGAWVASRMAVTRGEKLVKGVLIVTLAIMVVRYLEIIPGF